MAPGGGGLLTGIGGGELLMGSGMGVRTRLEDAVAIGGWASLRGEVHCAGCGSPAGTERKRASSLKVSNTAPPPPVLPPPLLGRGRWGPLGGGPLGPRESV
jgi:hypothetical protein